MPSTSSSTASPRISRIVGGCTSVSIVRATAGFRRSEASFGAFVVVHMTISAPFQVNAIGTTLGVPSGATYANRAMSRPSISWLIGFRRISATSLLIVCSSCSGGPVGRGPPRDGAVTGFSTWTRRGSPATLDQVGAGVSSGARRRILSIGRPLASSSTSLSR